jgi:hypothetical protein
MGRYGWVSGAGRVTVVAAAGAFIGWAISRDADWAMAFPRAAIRRARPGHGRRAPFH